MLDCDNVRTDPLNSGCLYFHGFEQKKATGFYDTAEFSKVSSSDCES